MASIYLGWKNKMVVWKCVTVGRTKNSPPSFKEAKEAEIALLEIGKASEGGLVCALLHIWAETAQCEVRKVNDWHVVVPNENTAYDGVFHIQSMLNLRDEDEWLLDRYRDSLDLLEWHQLGQEGNWLMNMLEVAKRGPSADAVRVLCDRVDSLLLERPNCLLDSYHWRLKEAKRSGT